MPDFDDQSSTPPDFFLKAVCFELTLALTAFLVGAILRYNPTSTMVPAQASVQAILWLTVVGIAAALPMIGILLVLDRFPVGPFRQLQELTNRTIMPLFAGQALWKLLVLSAAAGFGEEVLFRGLVQARLAESFPEIVGLLAGAVLFGVCHWISTTYALMAAVMGLYLGGLLIVTDSLLVPILTHAAYDFLALAYFLKWRGKSSLSIETVE